MSSIPETMAAVLLTGHGGFEKLEYREDVTVPQPKMGEVLVRVLAADNSSLVRELLRSCCFSFSSNFRCFN